MAAAAAESNPRPRAREHKSRHVFDQQRRREVALERQKTARRDLQSLVRRLATLEPCSATLENHVESVGGDRMERNPYYVVGDHMENEAAWGGSAHVDAKATPMEETVMEGGGQESDRREEGGTGWGGGRRQDGVGVGIVGSGGAREWASRQFMQPEWMLDVPSKLRSDWYVMARPEGKRCLVVSASGSTVSRVRDGRVLHKFPSALPNGARVKNVAGPNHMYCILDCIFHEPDQTYYVIDMMCWRGYLLYDCATEFRFFWIHSKLPETDACNSPSHFHKYRFCPVPVYECTLEGLEAAYHGPIPFQRDGLLFFNRHAHYSLSLTPLVLLWKDARSSRYFVDTDSQGNIPPFQQVLLELREDHTVVTCDDPPIVIGTLPESFVKQNEKDLRTGRILRFAIGDAGLQIEGGRPVVADIHYLGLGNPRRGADSCSKILFQYAARHDPLTIEELIAGVRSSDGDGDAVM